MSTSLPSGPAPSGFSTGLIPRDYKSHPPGYLSYAPAFSEALILPEVEWEERLREQKAAKASLFDIRERYYEHLKSLNQDGLGLCWAFSTTKAVMYLQSLMSVPTVRLSAWWVAGKIKNWRDQGGWGAESLEGFVNRGAPKESLCPGYKSSYDTSECQADAAKHKVTEWWDGTNSKDKNRAIMISCFLQNIPHADDFNHLSHSMCGCYLESINPLVIWEDNSWSESYGTKGLMKLSGSKAIPDGIAIPRVTYPV